QKARVASARELSGLKAASVFLDLTKLQLYRSRSTEDQDGNLDSTLLVVDFFNHAIKVCKRTFNNANNFTRLEQGLGLRLVRTTLYTTQDCLCFALGDRSRLVFGTTNETKNPRGILDKMPRSIVHFHLDQYVPGIELALTLALFPVTHFNDFLGRNQDLTEFVFHSFERNTLFQSAHYVLFEARIRMNDVPALSHCPLLLTDKAGDQPT